MAGPDGNFCLPEFFPPVPKKRVLVPERISCSIFTSTHPDRKYVSLEKSCNSQTNDLGDFEAHESAARISEPKGEKMDDRCKIRDVLKKLESHRAAVEHHGNASESDTRARDTVSRDSLSGANTTQPTRVGKFLRKYSQSLLPERR